MRRLRGGLVGTVAMKAMLPVAVLVMCLWAGEALSTTADKPPSPPRTLYVDSISGKDSMVISWRPPVILGKNVTEYRIQMATFGPNMTKTHAFKNADYVGKCRTGPELTCVAYKMQPGVRYRFRARAGVDGTFGPYSRFLDFTFPSAPPPPTSAMATKTTPTSIKIEWIAPLYPDTPHGEILFEGNKTNIPRDTHPLTSAYLVPVLGYEIQTGMGPAGELQDAFQEASNQTSQVLNDLQAGTLYRFRARAWNIVGYSEWGDVAAAFTNTFVPEAPAYINFSQVTTTSCHVEWHRPAPGGGKIQHYEILMVQEDGKVVKPPKLVYSGTGTYNSTTLKDLHAGWIYGLRVRAVNGMGPGAFSKTQTVRLLDPIPNRPPPPRVTARTNETMKIEMEPAIESSGAVIKEFELAQALERMDQESGVYNFASTYRGHRRSIEQKQLAVGSCYRFRVRTISETGTVSEWSHDGRGCTVSMTPRAPLIPHVVNETVSTLTVRWARPAGRGNDDITYHLEMMGPAAVPAVAEGGVEALPLSVAGRFTRVYSGKETAYEATTLLPDTVYIFRVVAENLVGPSEVSPQAPGRTRALLPEVPEPPVLQHRGADFLKVKWKVPALTGQQTEAVTSMELQAATGTAESGSLALWKDVLQHPQYTDFKLVGLRPNSGYRFRVRAQNAMGFSEWSQPFSATTAATAPERVTGLRITEKNPMHVKLAWDPAETNGQPVFSYVVQVAIQDPTTTLVRKAAESVLPKLGEYKTVQADLRSNVTLTVNMHIMLGEMCSVRVKSTSGAGDSEWSDPLTFWSKPDERGLPYPADQVKRPILSQVTDTSALVSWDRPDDNGGPIAQFYVEVALLDDSVCYLNTKLGDTKSYKDCDLVWLAAGTRILTPFTEGCETRPGELVMKNGKKVQPMAPLTCKLERLIPGARYAVRVKALNFIGYSDPSAAALLPLYPEGHAQPPKLLRPFITYSDTKNVALKWSPDALPGTGVSERIEGYDVGMRNIPSALRDRLSRLEGMVRRSKRMLALEEDAEGSYATTEKLSNETVDALLSSYSDSVNLVQKMLNDLPCVHVSRQYVADGTDHTFYASGLEPGQGYAFSVRAFDADGEGAWSDGVFVSLSADTPSQPPPVYLREAGTDYLLLEVRPGHPQGSALTSNIVQMQVVEDTTIGRWSSFHMLTRLPAEPVPMVDEDTGLQDQVQLLRVSDIPPNTNFGFRAASSNGVGLGELSIPMRYWTKPAPLTRPNTPLVAKIGSRVLGVMVDRPVPANMMRKMRSNEPVRGTLPTPTKNADGMYTMSALDYLYASHTDIDTAEPGKGGLSPTKYEIEMNVGPERQFETLCSQESPKCTLEGLAPATKFIMRARVVEPWGASAWSFPVAAQTLPTVPGTPSPVKVSWINQRSVKLSWTPPNPNGSPLIAFEVVGARVPRKLRKYTKTVVTTYTPPGNYRAGPTDGLPMYILSQALKEKDIPTEHDLMMAKDEDEEDDDIWFDEDKGEQDYSAAGAVQVVPNYLSWEAVATVKSLPEPDLPGYLAQDVEARKKFKAQELADDEIGSDFTESFLVSVSNTSELNVVWNLPLRPSTGMYVARVRALNKNGFGPLSPLIRFYGSSGGAAMPPDEPYAVETSRVTLATMTLTWAPPRDNGAVIYEYVLRALVGKELDPKRVELDPKLFQDIYTGPDTTHTLKNLVPGSWFYFYLIARNSVGQSPPSPLVLFRLPGEPKDAPMVSFNETAHEEQMKEMLRRQRAEAEGHEEDADIVNVEESQRSAQHWRAR